MENRSCRVDRGPPEADLLGDLTDLGRTEILYFTPCGVDGRQQAGKLHVNNSLGEADMV